VKTAISEDEDAYRGSAVREWSLIAVMLAVAWLPSVLSFLAVVAVILAWGPRWAVLSPVALVVTGFVRGAAERKRLPGRAVRPGDEPELAALVQDVAERLDFRAPLLVRIVPVPDAALGRAKVDGVRSYVLVLGLPLLRALTAAQLASVVAHELAHQQHARDRRTSWLQKARADLAERLNRRFRPSAPLAAPLLRASQPRVWRAETAADADAARIAGTTATAQALDRTGLLLAAFDGLAEKWWSVLAQDGSYPQDFYDAFDVALRDPHVIRRSARACAEDDALDPYAVADHPPLAQRLAALPHVDASTPYGAAPLALRTAAAVERWCVKQLADLDGQAPPDSGPGRKQAAQDGRRPDPGKGGRPDALRPARLLDLDPDRLSELVDEFLDGDGPLPLLVATRRKSPAEALSAALDCVADGSWPRLARRIEPQLRWVPAVARPAASHDALIGAMGQVLALVLRNAGWSYTGRWLDTVLTAQDGAVVDLHELLSDAVDSQNPGPVRALLPTAGTEAAAV
jgi:Zn-dependent protease with chaperone function